MPFDVKVIFLSNLAPEELVDPAFARRMGYKIHIQPLEASGYRTVIGAGLRAIRRPARSGVH